MKTKHILIHAGLAMSLFIGLWSCNTPSGQHEEVSLTDPLPSWNEGHSKKAIQDFVSQSTDSSNNGYIPVNERIAVFDNDGTLWSGQPKYFQFLFVLDRVVALAPEHPEWKDQQPFRAVLENDMEALMRSGVDGLATLTMATHAGLSTDEFEKIAREWIDTARHPQKDMLYKEMVFQPMLEVLDYLRATCRCCNGPKPEDKTG